MSKAQLDKVNFEIIRYANCWEDADILLAALQTDQNSTVMSIASAGDNSFSLLSTGAKVIAVDISKVQLYLVELKKETIRAFNRDEYLEFVGFTESNRRIELFDKIKTQLSPNCLKYWKNNIDAITDGVIHTGKFERYFQLFKKEFLHKVHNQRTVDELISKKSNEDQRRFHDETWHTDEWKKMYKFFFGEQMLGDKGRDPEFLKYVEGNVSDMILAQEVQHLRTSKAQSNYFLYYILNNQFSEDFLPHYVRTENYDKAKANIDNLVLHEGLLDSATKAYSDCTHFNLSDIFEYMDVPLFRIVAKDIIDNSANKAKIVYWNLMIPRFISEQFPNEVEYDKDLSEQLKKRDRGYFYRSFNVEQKK